ncbi:type II secretion system protein M [Rhodoferax sp. 4810]|uniref:Type II secretion system protein M n=1 Tax=Thiospirillum jenense TaxID=1653858 RepID=A0A839H3X4_9GAMM|nr:type II secretion system protein GspM [Thiospirillum jenense]MBB1072967.1 type II secretion system protein M [Rhodoferax jenense]MBB1124915.1 type II secretion system protein M [Thiospirillum jenense]
MPTTSFSNLRCIFAWSSVVLLPMLIILAIGIPWWQRLQTLNTRLTRDQDQLVRYQQLVATIPQLQAELAQVKTQDKNTKAFYFSAATVSLAGAQLQEQVQEMIRTAGGRPVSTQMLPLDEKEQPPRVRIRLQLQATNEALLKLLYQIEAARPFLFIDQLSIRSAANDSPDPPAARRRLPNNAPPPVPPRERDDLTVRLDIFGFVLGSNAP